MFQLCTVTLQYFRYLHMFLKATFVNIVKIASELKSLEDTKSTNQHSKCEDALGSVCFHLVITDNKMLLCF